MTVYDSIRHAHVKATPEELVRSRLLLYMTEMLGYPKHLLVVEKQLCQLPGYEQAPNRRLDVICYARGGRDPLLLIECKAGMLKKNATEQVLGYNHYVKAPFVAVVGESEIRMGYIDKGKYVFVSGLPHYEKLLEALC